MKRKSCGFLFGILIFLSGILSCQAQNITLPPEKHTVIIEKPLKQSFSDFARTGLNDYIGNLQVRLIPGGQSIGVLLESKGVVVTGQSAVLTEAGKISYPAAGTGIKAGDVILKINGITVKNENQFREMVARAGTTGCPAILEIKRGQDIFFTRIDPVFCRETLGYRLGLSVKDSVAGIGTLTFYEPENLFYGALGHIISDLNNSPEKPLELSGGKIIGADVQGIYRGKRGRPGEKIGILHEGANLNGTIEENTRLGIFGILQRPLKNQFYNKPLEVAAAEEINEGQAEVLTVLEGDKVENFRVEITEINLHGREDGKGLVLKITDRRLLDMAGGIVQGMSGSPIIQNNKLVGAVTHVFVNDPVRGYGVPVEWMLNESNILKSTVNNLNEPKIAS